MEGAQKPTPLRGGNISAALLTALRTAIAKGSAEVILASSMVGLGGSISGNGGGGSHGPTSMGGSWLNDLRSMRMVDDLQGLRSLHGRAYI